MNNQNEVEKMVEFFKDEKKLNLVMAQMATANNYGQNGSTIGGPMANANYQQQNNVTGSSVDGFTMMAANDNFMHCPPPSNPPHSVESNLAICSPQFVDHGYHSLPNSRKSSYNLALTNPPTPHGNLDGAAKPSHQMESMSIVDPIRYMAEDDDEEQQKEGGAGTLGHHWGMPSNMLPSKSVGHQLGQMAIGIGSTAGQSRQQHQWMNIMDGGGGDKGDGSNQQQSTSGYCKPEQQITTNNYPATLQQQQHHFQPYSPQLLKDYVDSSAWDYWQHLCRQQQQSSQQQQAPLLSSATTAHQQSPTPPFFIGQFDQTFGGQSMFPMPFPSSSPLDQLSPTVAYDQQKNNENAIPPMENATKAKEKRNANGGRLMKVSPMSFKQKQFAASSPAVCHYQGALDVSARSGQLGGNQTLGNGVGGEEQGQVEMMTTIKEVAKSPIIDFLCDILAMPAVYNHICAFIGPREFLIRDPKIFTQLLNVAKTGPNQKEKSYLQISRALKSFEERKINDLVMMRKVPNKRNQYKFYPDL